MYAPIPSGLWGVFIVIIVYFALDLLKYTVENACQSVIVNLTVLFGRKIVSSQIVLA